MLLLGMRFGGGILFMMGRLGFLLSMEFGILEGLVLVGRVMELVFRLWMLIGRLG